MKLDPFWSVPEAPSFHKLLTLQIILPIFASAVFFYLISRLVRSYLWNDYKGFRQYRLHNLTICFLHSSLSGIWVLLFALTHIDIMLNDPVFYFRPYMRIIIIVTLGYLIHDTVDMLQYEISRWTIELLLHHMATAFVMSVPACGERFTGYAYWSLLMEVNSIFLHMRTLFQLSGARESYPKTYEVVKYLNLITFIIFRFAVQIWQTHFVLVYREHYHFFYFACGFYGGLLFLFINTLLFVRVLASDGFLCNIVKSYLAINRFSQIFTIIIPLFRDEQKTIKEA